VRFVDPIKDPLLAKEFGLTERTGLAVLAGQSRHVIEQPNESEITNAVLNVTQGMRGRVYFLQGHGEADPEAAPDAQGLPQQQQARSVKVAADGLRNENYPVARLDLLTAGSVPADAAALVIAGPAKPLAPAEIQAVSDYLAAGGRGLLLLDPLAPTGLEPLLEQYGVTLPESVIIEQSLRLFQGPTLGIEFISTDFTQHQITSKLREGVVFVLARAVIPREVRPEATYVTTLLSSGPGSWAEIDVTRLLDKQEIELGADDVPGPVSIAVAVERLSGESKAARLVVVGDSDFAGDELVSLGRDNAALFVNALNWLTESEAIDVIPNRYASSAFMLDPTQAGLLFYAIVFVVPQLLTLLGIALISVRRMSR